MPWGRMDDKLHRNRKVRALRRMKGGREALGDWTFWWSWCLDDPNLDGVVPAVELDTSELRSAKLLVEVGLWDEAENGYRFHDFHEYNPTREQVEKKREADRDRAAVKRESHASRTRVADESKATRELVVGASHPRAIPIPSHPIPNPTEEEPAAAARARTWFSEASGRDDFDHRGRWRHAFTEIAGKPQDDLDRAQATLRRAFDAKLLDRRKTTPQHVLDYWATYAAGETPRDPKQSQSRPTTSDADAARHPSRQVLR